MNPVEVLRLPIDVVVERELTRLEDVRGAAGLEAFVLWVAEDIPSSGPTAALRRLRRQGDPASLAALSEAARGLSHAGAAACLIGIPTARAPEAASVVAALQLANRGARAPQGARQAAEMHTLHATLTVVRQGGDGDAQRIAAAKAAKRQLKAVEAIRAGEMPVGGLPDPEVDALRYLICESSGRDGYSRFALELPSDAEMDELHEWMYARFREQGLTPEQIEGEIEILKMHGFW